MSSLSPGFLKLRNQNVVQVLAEQCRARTATMTLPHFTAETPMFMPVGTQGSQWHKTHNIIKHISSIRQVQDHSRCRLCERFDQPAVDRCRLPRHSWQHLPLGESTRLRSHRPIGRLAQVHQVETRHAHRFRRFPGRLRTTCCLKRFCQNCSSRSESGLHPVQQQG